MIGGSATPDPYFLVDYNFGAGNFNYPWQVTAGRAVRSQTIDPTKKTLILIMAGASNTGHISPTLYPITNSSVIDSFNLYDGEIYDASDGLFGASFSGPASTSRGILAARVADKIVTAGSFDRVIIAAIGIAGSAMADWAPGGRLYDRVGVVMRRLKAKGITAATTGVTFTYVLGLGENDNTQGISQATFTTGLNAMIAKLIAEGMTGRIFINRETWINGATSAAIQAAQAAVVNGTNVFQGGNLDTLDATNRFDNTHFSDAGAAAAVTLIYNAMHASGAPF
jgi:hypothetical protein